MEDINLTNSEWYVMDCLWQRTSMTVMELVGALNQRLGWAKSTTITTLRRMEDKGLVLCRTQGRTKHYSPAVSKDRGANKPLHPRRIQRPGRPSGNPVLFG